jgi:hypothetical protein
MLRGAMGGVGKRASWQRSRWSLGWLVWEARISCDISGITTHLERMPWERLPLNLYEIILLVNFILIHVILIPAYRSDWAGDGEKWG